MERIRQALERAEQDRSKLTERAQTEPGREAPASEPDPVQPLHESVAEPKFNRTKIIDVSAEVLEANRLVAAIPGHELTDVYRILRTRVLLSFRLSDRRGWAGR